MSSVVVDLNADSSSTTNTRATVAAYGIYDGPTRYRSKLVLLNFNYPKNATVTPRDDRADVRAPPEPRGHGGHPLPARAERHGAEQHLVGGPDGAGERRAAALWGPDHAYGVVPWRVRDRGARAWARVGLA